MRRWCRRPGLPRWPAPCSACSAGPSRCGRWPSTASCRPAGRRPEFPRPAAPAGSGLLGHQLHAAVSGAAGLIAVAGHRCQRGQAPGGEALGVNLVGRRGERRHHGLGAREAELLVGVEAADIVGVADDPGFQRRLGLQQLGHRVELGLGFGLELGLAGVEEQAREGHTAFGGEALADGLGVHRDLAGGHGLGLDDLDVAGAAVGVLVVGQRGEDQHLQRGAATAEGAGQDVGLVEGDRHFQPPACAAEVVALDAHQRALGPLHGLAAVAQVEREVGVGAGGLAVAAEAGLEAGGHQRLLLVAKDFERCLARRAQVEQPRDLALGLHRVGELLAVVLKYTTRPGQLGGGPVLLAIAHQQAAGEAADHGVVGGAGDVGGREIIGRAGERAGHRQGEQGGEREGGANSCHGRRGVKQTRC
mmetsp:Transcript_652/g.1375  ORF Transcript_652/g.1375 Transcript_652/m.1375 type:complete len:418 (-) Transcript_652:794-2047(-)